MRLGNLGILALAVIAACAKDTNGRGDSSIVLGAIVSRNGVASSYGRDNERGLAIAESYINETGGIHGRKVRIRPEDSNSDPAQAVTLARTLAGDKSVIGILGPTRTNEAVAVARIAPDMRLPVISIGSTGDWEAAAGGPFNDWTFRSTRQDASLIEPLLRAARDSFGVKRIAILSLTDDDWSKSVTPIFERAAPTLGIQIVDRETASARDDDWSVQLSKIRAASPDAIVLNVLADKAPSVVRQAHDKGIRARFIGTAAFTNPSTWPNAGPNGLDGTLVGENYFAGNPRPIVQAFVTRYQKQFGQEPPSYAAYAFDGALLLAEAARRAADPFNRAEVRDSLSHISRFQAVLGTVTYHGSGDAEKTPLVLQIEHGAFHLVNQ